jgi:hypothetical protein
MSSCLSAQTLLKTENFGSSEIIIPFQDNYFIYQNGGSLNQYNSKHEFVKKYMCLTH